MKLVYLWIYKYKNIENMGINLSSYYRVEMSGNKRFKIVLNKGLDKFIYTENTSIMALVGENGAGKSTVLDALRSILFDKQSHKQSLKGFIVYETDGEFYLYDAASDIDKIVETDESIKKTVKKHPSDAFYNASLIYYSDFLDLKYYLNNFDDGEDEPYNTTKGYFIDRNNRQVNISTSYLIRDSKCGILDYFHRDIKWQIKYYNKINRKTNKEMNTDVIPFEIPKQLNIEIDILDYNIYNDLLDHTILDYANNADLKMIIGNSKTVFILTKMQKYIIDVSLKNGNRMLSLNQVIMWNVFSLYLYNRLSERKNETEKVTDNYDDIDSELVTFLKRKSMDDQSIIKIIESIFENNLTEEFKPYIRFYTDWKNLVENEKTIKSNQTINVKFTAGDDMQLFEETRKQLSSMNIKLLYDDFIKMFSSYCEISYEIDFMSFSWGLSSGESSLFNLFARLVHALERLSNNQDIIVLFDELDSSFHPRWQQRILASLVDFFEKYNNQRFQIILTTHSPVLLSDIPKDNVVFLRHENNESNDKEYEHKQTFAANIGSLYYDSFFMENGSVGIIAKQTIRYLMQQMQDVIDDKKQIDNDSIERFQNIIDIIGEDIWRYKLNQKLEEVKKHCKYVNESDYIKNKIIDQVVQLSQLKGKEEVKDLLQYLSRVELEDNNNDTN